MALRAAASKAATEEATKEMTRPCRPAGPRSLYELPRTRSGDDDEGSDEDDGEGVGLRALMEAEVP